MGKRSSVTMDHKDIRLNVEFCMKSGHAQDLLMESGLTSMQQLREIASGMARLTENGFRQLDRALAHIPAGHS